MKENCWSWNVAEIKYLIRYIWFDLIWSQSMFGWFVNTNNVVLVSLQKVDLFSLGIILFEMSYRPMSTASERIFVLGQLRKVSDWSPDECFWVSPVFPVKPSWTLLSLRSNDTLNSFCANIQLYNIIVKNDFYLLCRCIIKL